METTDYYGMFVCTNDHIDYILTAEGRLKYNDHNYQFYEEYFIKDHLGNVRDVITTDPAYTNNNTQVTDYYPFGLEIPVTNVSDNHLLYNGKELQTDAKLEWYDYGARFYDPQLGRWHSVDGKAEKYYSLNPYAYCLNNPLKFIDPDGKDIKIAGNEEYRENTFNTLQKLSSNQLLLLNNGQVVEAKSYSGPKSDIVSSGVVTTGNEKPIGTSLVSNLIDKHQHTVMITGYTEDHKSGEFVPKSETDASTKDVGSDGTAYFENAPAGQGRYINTGAVDEDNNTMQSEESLLSHELIHANNSFDGTVDYTKLKLIDPDNPMESLTQEELTTREKENVIRDEQGDFSHRRIPKH